MVDLLLDTNVFIWLDTEPKKLSESVKKLIQNPANRLYLSSISAWELCQKSAIGKLPLPFPVQQFITQACEQYAILPLPFDAESAFQLSHLPHIHADPFDRMLICQAIQHSLAILTNDRAIQAYPIKTLW